MTMKDKKITLRLPEEVHEALKQMSGELNIGINSLVNLAIAYHVGKFSNNAQLQ